MVKIVFVFVILFGFAHTQLTSWGGNGCCYQIEDDGHYCYEDLSGYYYCYYDDDPWCMETGAQVKCPPGTRCSCYIDDSCRMNVSSICQPYESPAKFKESFSIVYQQITRYEPTDTWDADYVARNVSEYGFVIRDPEKKKFFSMHDGKYRLIQEEEDGVLIEYNWRRSKTSKCSRRKYKESKFPFPFPEIKDLPKFDLKSSTRIGNKYLQEWYFKVGRDSWAFDLYKKWWKISYDPQQDRILPTQFYQTMVPGEFGDRKYKTITFKENSGIIFGVPDKCKTKPVIKTADKENSTDKENLADKGKPINKGKPEGKRMKFRESFSLSYTNVTWYGPSEIWNDAQINSNNVTKSGFVIRDPEQKQYFSKLDDTYTLIREEEGKLVEYHWYKSYEEECGRLKYKKLELPWPHLPELVDISKYDLKSSIQYGDKQLQKWYYQFGEDQWADDVYKRMWKISFDPKEDRILPVEFHQSLTRGGFGEVEHKTITFKENLTIKFGLPDDCTYWFTPEGRGRYNWEDT